MADNCRLHARYIIGILAAIIIICVTLKFGGQEDLVGYLMFALALTSLVVGVLAIAFAFSSNSSFSISIGRMTDASDRVAETTTELSDATADLKAEIARVPKALESFKGDVKKQIDEGFQKQARPDAGAGVDTSTGAKQRVEHFILRASLGGLLQLLACELAVRQPCKSYDLRVLTERLAYGNDQYAHGFLVGASSSGFVDVRYDSPTLYVHGVVQDIGTLARSEYKRRVSLLDDGGFKSDAEANIGIVEKYFKELAGE